MQTADAPTLTERVDRFLRWFFAVTPEALIESRPSTHHAANRRTVARSKPAPLLPRHAGPVRVPVKAEQ